MAGGASANPSNLSSTPVSTPGATTSAYTPRFATLPAAPTASAPGATYTLSAPPQQGFAQQGAPYQPFASRMPTSVSGYGNFPQAQTSVNRGPTPDQIRAQMAAYQQQYKPGMQGAQSEVQQFNVRLRQAEADRKAEIARKAAEAAAAAEAERQRQEAMWYGGNGEGSEGNGAQMAGATGGLASLQGFQR